MIRFTSLGDAGSVADFIELVGASNIISINFETKYVYVGTHSGEVYGEWYVFYNEDEEIHRKLVERVRAIEKEKRLAKAISEMREEVRNKESKDGRNSNDD